MILSDQDIKKLIKDGKIKIEPFEESQIGSASIDLTLGNEWSTFKKEFLGKTIDLDKTSFKESFDVKISPNITLAPGQLCLAITKEKITLPSDIMGKLEGRSRFARMGLIIHTTSALVQPGSSNRQVLEIVNLAPFPVTIHENMRISQVVLEKLESPTTKPYAKFGKIATNQ